MRKKREKDKEAAKDAIEFKRLALQEKLAKTFKEHLKKKKSYLIYRGLDEARKGNTERTDGLDRFFKNL